MTNPPFTITPRILALVADIAVATERIGVQAKRMNPNLRRGNRIRTIQASLAIEQNTLTLEQVTALLEGKRVLGAPREIQEVRNAFAAYEALQGWDPAQERDLLVAHGILMQGLVDRAGKYRVGGVGITQGQKVVHMAPPAGRVTALVRNLQSWLATTDVHLLVASCVFHYEFEFIHPFQDGNGRMGRLWQTLILSRWNPLFAWLPVESVVRDRQVDYYAVLGRCDKAGASTEFVEFLLEAILSALRELPRTEQVAEQVAEQVERLLQAIGTRELGTGDLMKALDLLHRPTFLKNYLDPALKAGLVERTDPASPRSPRQKYRRTELGRNALARNKK
jgi:Fic family protein